MRTRALLFCAGMALAAPPSRAQSVDARLSDAGAGIGRALAERYRGVPGDWTIELVPGCERPEQDRACILRDPVPAANLGRAISALAIALGSPTAADAVAHAISVRKQNLDRARVGGTIPTCGDQRVDGPLAKIVRVAQVRVTPDTVEARISVLHLGRLAGCPAGMHVLHAAVIRAPSGLPRVELSPAGHYEVAIEIPRNPRQEVAGRPTRPAQGGRS